MHMVMKRPVGLVGYNTTATSCQSSVLVVLKINHAISGHVGHLMIWSISLLLLNQYGIACYYKPCSVVTMSL